MGLKITQLQGEYAARSPAQSSLHTNTSSILVSPRSISSGMVES